MLVDGTPKRSIWEHAGDVVVIDQRVLPHRLETMTLRTVEDAAFAIRDMVVRGAPLIGATAAYGLWLALRAGIRDEAGLRAAHTKLASTRPTAVNLRWALDRVAAVVRRSGPPEAWAAVALAEARLICDEDVACNHAIGTHGLALLRAAWERRRAAGASRLNILTHCNAGWIATVDWGTATAPIYLALAEGIPVHVWVDETRPRNQGASLTAWELGQNRVPHTLIVDNCGGHLMQHGLVDLCIVGTDRVSACGDVANKIGTYLKALAARDNGVPFYVAAPSSSIDFSLRDGVAEIPIEERDPREVTHLRGLLADGTLGEIRICPVDTPAANHGFDVTPARLVTALITERGVVQAEEGALQALFRG